MNARQRWRRDLMRGPVQGAAAVVLGVLVAIVYFELVLPGQAAIAATILLATMAIYSVALGAPKPRSELIARMQAEHGLSDVDVSSRSHLTAALYRMVSTGNSKAVPMLVAAGADVNIQAGEARATPLHMALTNDDAEMVDVLLQCRCALDVPMFNGKTEMHLVAMKGNVTLARKLLAAGARGDLADREGDFTPLMLAAAYGKDNDARALMVELLIDAGVNLDARDKKQHMTALDYAVAANFTMAAEKLRRSNATKSRAPAKELT